MASYPRGVTHCSHVKRNPYQARVWWAGRRWSLGYFPTIQAASQAVEQCRQEIARWAAMNLPPPMLALQHRERTARAGSPGAADHPPT
jgi:hypothetical protein